MRATKYLLNLILIAAFLCSGLHHFRPGDLNRDNRLSLEDAILHITDEGLMAGNLASIISDIKKAHSILEILAGLKKDIKSAKEKSLAFSPDLPFLLASNKILTTLDEFSRVSERDLFYESNIITPDSPPPRRV
jgi:hypothetical protein